MIQLAQFFISFVISVSTNPKHRAPSKKRSSENPQALISSSQKKDDKISAQ